MSDDKKAPSRLLDKTKRAEKSTSWNEAAKQRFLKQHGTLDVHELPDTDAHAIKEYKDPTYFPPASPEETKAAEDALKEKIAKLKDQGQTPVPKKSTDGNFYDEWID